ncbi:MAG: CTP synthase [Myxococcales bacterium]|nr:CTP synthase [Myxococcales bacterium]
MARNKPTKYIFVTGGVVSSIGKGLSAAVLGALLEARGLSVTNVKLDPYINVDPGTMSPFQHGEVFVTDDGAETDLDLGHYERFTTATMAKSNNFTTGQVYDAVISRERQGGYLGRTVQVIPHVTDEIKAKIRNGAEGVDVAIIEIGGTVGDIESLPFMEAIRQMRLDVGSRNAVNIHVTLLPYIKTAGEVKTKPTQHSVKELRQIGIQPDIILCRHDHPLESNTRDKISLFCNVEKKHVILAPDVDCIYDLPERLHLEGFDDAVADLLDIWSREPDISAWKRFAHTFKKTETRTIIGIVGKYVELKESYKSLHEALVHGGVANDSRVELRYIDAETIEKDGPEALLAGLDGILVPGGFGKRGVEGKIAAVQYARERGLPYFGICLGMQISVIEFARNVVGIADAHSTEFVEDTAEPIIHLMEEQRDIEHKGGSMRLGAYPCLLSEGSLAHKIYGTTRVSERHRHRYEVNTDYADRLTEKGMKLSGMSPDGLLPEMCEIPSHPYFVACQFHPEFKSRPTRPHPLFTRFVAACLAEQAKTAAA